jgi:hypothetical protein
VKSQSDLYYQSTSMTLGQIAYEAYCAARNWKSIRGEPLPQYLAQEKGIVDAWEKAAAAVAEHLRIQGSLG